MVPRGILGLGLFGALLWFLLFKVAGIGAGASLWITVAFVIGIIALLKGIPALRGLDIFNVSGSFPLDQRMSMYVGIALVLFSAFSFGWLSTDMFKFQGSTATVTTPSGEEVLTCGDVSAISLDANYNDKYNPGTDQDVRLVVGNDKTFSTVYADVADQSAVSVPPLTTVALIAGDDSDTGADSSDDWYYQLIDFSTTCTTPTFARFDLVKEGTPTITVINSDGVTKNSASNEESIGAEEVKTLTVKITAPNDAGFGNKYCSNAPAYYNGQSGIVVTFDHTTNISSISVNGAQAISVPADRVGTDEEAYVLPITGLEDLEEYTFKVVIQASGTDPVNDVTMTLKDPNYFRANYDGTNYKAGQWICGVATDSLTPSDVGASDVSTTIYLA